MAAKKYYAVKKGKVKGVFDNWKDCKASVDGVTGAVYKGFGSLEEAKDFLGDYAPGEHALVEHALSEHAGTESQSEKQVPADPSKVLVYVDGSYEHKIKKYSFGCVFILADGRVFTESGNGDNPDSLKLRNVTGEMLGAMFAVKFAMVNGFSEIEICYDYVGIEKWVIGSWKSKTELTIKYAQTMQEWSRQIKINFTKVAAHTNIYYNEMADQLAKDALRSGDGIPKVRRLEEMEAENA